MTIRSILATAFAALVLSAAVAPTVEAATMRRPARPMMARKPMMSRQAMNARQMPRGGDTQNADVDRLNAQSLAAARGQ